MDGWTRHIIVELKSIENGRNRYLDFDGGTDPFTKIIGAMLALLVIIGLIDTIGGWLRNGRLPLTEVLRRSRVRLHGQWGQAARPGRMRMPRIRMNSQSVSTKLLRSGILFFWMDLNGIWSLAKLLRQLPTLSCPRHSRLLARES